MQGARGSTISLIHCELNEKNFDPLRVWPVSALYFRLIQKKTEFNQIDNTTPFLIVSKWFSKWIKINLESVLRYLVNEIFRLWILHSMWKSWRSQWSQYLPRLGLLTKLLTNYLSDTVSLTRYWWPSISDKLVTNPS